MPGNWDIPVNVPVAKLVCQSLYRFGSFRENVLRWLENPVLDEVEFYETLLYTDRPECLRIIWETLAT